ncbi:methyltransferase domain-containing protein [Tenacibaculum aiptasiae]|uniref:Methyltransferase domain-containing protein n=1 Tax=Tenacibaculum aiptasiae TaxID=426481 RepID=A0A7J5A9E1_9FLAO|nr:methyltransferase domain-containing protein [Tenacibaculum aiptasiae]KAB1154186.1 methyltransferase domain-containing protein [Tenacibaculum aiptasiae]
MKKTKSKLTIPNLLCLVLITFTGANCNAQKHGKHGQHKHLPAKELAKHLDAKDRDSWQKPKDVLALIGDLKNKKVLDIGAGTGYFSFKMVDAEANVIAADVDNDFIEILNHKRKEKKVSSKAMQIRKIPFNTPDLKKEEVDIVLIVDTYHHIENRVNYFKKVKFGMQSNGKLVIVDYKKDKSITDGPSYEMRIKESDVIQELKKAGFVDFKINSNLLSKQYIIEAFLIPQKKVSEAEFLKAYFNKEYAKDEYLYGKKPDKYLAKILPQHKPGKILFPGEGEGRNAVFAAKLGWDVTAYDYSTEAKKKALKLAKANDVNIKYTVQDIVNASYPKESFDAIAFLFIHFAGQERIDINKKMDKHLKKGGLLIIETFSTNHPKISKEGPQEIPYLYDKESILRDFPNYEIIELKVETDILLEGNKSELKASILRFVGRKK